MLLLLLCALAAAGTVQLQPGVQYTAGQRVAAAEVGVSFVIPPAWKGTLPPGAEAMLLASDTERGMVMVTADRGITLPMLQQSLSQPMQLDLFTVLVPNGAPTVSGSSISQQLTTRNGEIAAHARGRVFDGTAILFVAMGPIAESDRIGRLADTLITSTRAEKAPAPAVASGGAGGAGGSLTAKAPTGAIANQLKGNKIYYLKSSNGFSDEWSANLCSDGTAVWSGNSSAFSGGAASTLSYASQDSGRGVWAVEGGNVVVRWTDGSHTTVPVSLSGGRVKFGKSNHWVQPQSVCP